MRKSYKISFFIYCGMLTFSILFMLLLLGASGHRVKFTINHYLTALFPVITTTLLYLFPKISNQKTSLKLSTGTSSLLLLTVSLFYSIQNIKTILTENLIIEFKIIATLFLGFFITIIVILFKEIVLELKCVNIH